MYYSRSQFSKHSQYFLISYDYCSMRTTCATYGCLISHFSSQLNIWSINGTIGIYIFGGVQILLPGWSIYISYNLQSGAGIPIQSDRQDFLLLIVISFHQLDCFDLYLLECNRWIFIESFRLFHPCL